MVPLQHRMRFVAKVFYVFERIGKNLSNVLVSATPVIQSDADVCLCRYPNLNRILHALLKKVLQPVPHHQVVEENAQLEVLNGRSVMEDVIHHRRPPLEP